MKNVTDATIDKIIDQLEATEESFEQALEKAADEQPMIFSYLSSEAFEEVLNEEERGYLVYLGLIIYLSYKATNPKLQDVSEDQLGEAEELNWEKLESAKGDDLIDNIEEVYADFSQKELLSVAAEAIMEDEEDESPVTDEGAAPLFIGLKTVIDAMIAATP
jgi:hypothetical protein